MTEIERTGQARSTMDPEELTEIVERLRIQHNDDENVEAKKCEAKLSNDVWESVSAFGNTSGGLILLGLDQENGFTVPPKFDIDKSIEQFVSGIQPRGGKLTNPPQYDLARVGFEGSQILAIRIAEVDLAQKPCFITSRGVENGSYKRVADKDMKPELLIEPGSAVVGDCMKFVGTVKTIKNVRGKWFATILGSQKNISMTGINPPMEVIAMGGEQKEYDNLDMVGFTCIEGDVLYHDYTGKLAHGDAIVISNCGSYSLVMKPPFILPNFPVLDICGNGVEVIKHGEVFDDLFHTFKF